MIRVFDSIAALRAEAIRTGAVKLEATTRTQMLFQANDWYGGESPGETLQKSQFGDTALVPEAESMLGLLDAAIETPRKIWDRNPAGAYCVVPDVLAGLPTPMRHMRYDSDDRAPITILAISTSSGGINAKMLLKRGTAILALVMALSRIRPVSLHSVSILNGNGDGSGETVLSTRLGTAPLDIATVCYALTSQGFARRMNYELSTKLNQDTGGWPKGFRYGKADGGGYYSYLAEKLSSIPQHTLVIGAAQLNDPIISDPIRWVNEQVVRFTQTQEDMENV